MSRSPMTFLTASDKHLLDVLFLLRHCVSKMNEAGMYHWNQFYPGRKQIESDINKKQLYLLSDQEIIKGMVVLNRQQPPEYKDISWINEDARVMVIHRLAVHPLFQRQGTGRHLMEFIIRQAQSKGASSLRLDVFSGNQLAGKLYREMGFKQTGTFHFPFQQTPFDCYELDYSVMDLPR